MVVLFFYCSVERYPPPPSPFWRLDMGYGSSLLALFALFNTIGCYALDARHVYDRLPPFPSSKWLA